MRGLVRDCWEEMVDRKAIWIIGVLTVMAVLVIFGTRSIRMMGGELEGVMEENPFAVDIVAGGLDFFLSLLVFIIVMTVAGIFPNMMVRGRAEFYLSKPMSRTSLLLNKLFSIWVVYGAAMIVAGLVAFAVFWLSFEVASWNLAYIFLLNLASLFIWLSIVIFAGVLSGSSALSIVSAFVVWLLQFMLSKYEAVEMLVDSKIVVTAVKWLYYIVPKTGEVSDITGQLAVGKAVESWMPLWSSLLFAVVLVIITLMVFKRKDY